MPTCEYPCEQCGHTFEQRERIAEHADVRSKCPKCESERVPKTSSAFYAKTSRKS